MHSSPIVVEDGFIQKQNNLFLQPIKAGYDTVYKTFKYQDGNNDKQRIKISRERDSILYDTCPADIDKKAFKLRPRIPSKEI